MRCPPRILLAEPALLTVLYVSRIDFFSERSTLILVGTQGIEHTTEFFIKSTPTTTVKEYLLTSLYTEYLKYEVDKYKRILHNTYIHHTYIHQTYMHAYIHIHTT